MNAAGSSRGVRALVFSVVMVLLAACATPPKGVLIPSETVAQGTTHVPLLVATTRRPSDEPGVLYDGERGFSIGVDEIVVSIPPEEAREVGEVQWPKKLPADPAREFATVSINKIEGTAEADEWLRRNQTTSKRLLIFVHGFNNRYESAVYRLAQIAHDSKIDATPVLFTWPSRGSVFAYVYDKESANYSRSALEEVLTVAAAHKDVDEVTVMAHSMGTWLAVEALRQMAIRNGRIAPKIKNVILAAPDLDVDVAMLQFLEMGPNPPHFTIFVSRDDRALRLSRRISGSVDRVGQIDVNDPRYRTVLQASEGVTVLDLTALRGGDGLNHAKFAQTPEVVQLLGGRLIAGQTVTDQSVGLGDEVGASVLSVTNAVGSAAGLVASVPLAAIDPASRDALEAQTAPFGGAATGLRPAFLSTTPAECDPADENCEQATQP